MPEPPFNEATATETSGTLWLETLGLEYAQRYVDAGGVRTRLVEAGRDGPTLVLLHGTGGHAETYARNLARLSRDFHVVAYDMVGHGFTDQPDEPYTLDVYAHQLDALVDALGVDRVFLSGESLGGWVAAWYAASRPERVERLVLTTPGNVRSKPEVMATIRENTMRAVAQASSETVRARLEWLFAPETRGLVTDELVDVRLALYRRPGAESAMANILVLQDPEVRPASSGARRGVRGSRRRRSSSGPRTTRLGRFPKASC